MLESKKTKGTTTFRGPAEGVKPGILGRVVWVEKRKLLFFYEILLCKRENSSVYKLVISVSSFSIELAAVASSRKCLLLRLSSGLQVHYFCDAK